MWSQCVQNHISWPDSFRARVRTTRVERHIGQSSGGGTRSIRQTGQNSSSRELSVGSVVRAGVTNVVNRVAHDGHVRNLEVQVVDVGLFEYVRSKVYTLQGTMSFLGVNAGRRNQTLRLVDTANCWRYSKVNALAFGRF